MSEKSKPDQEVKESLPQLVSIEKELKDSFKKFAYTVVIGRALPDARDGFKPVHRRTIFAMNQLSNHWNRPYKKSARIVGDVIGKYHPHGDSAVYDALVRMAQDFSLRYLLIDGQGNFGSIDGDSAAAMRYTEVRLTRLSSELLADLDSETVDFVWNYDNSELMPSVLPTRIPNLLMNGATGIAVGMATNIPPHHLGEVMRAVLAMIDDPHIQLEALMQHVQGPDFPTGGIICGRSGIIQAYRTGRGKIHVRAKCHIEMAQSDRPVIVIDELPYMVNKARLIEKISQLMKEKKLTGISVLRDESDREGMRVVIECQRGENAEVLLNKLFTMTAMQVVFGVNMVVLDDNQPKLMNLRDILACFIEHRRQVVRRRTQFELKKAQARGHLLEGLSVAVANLDSIVELIKQSKNVEEAKMKLLACTWPLETFAISLEDLYQEIGSMDDWKGYEAGHYRLSERQAQSILDLRLQRLTGLEREKIYADYLEIIQTIRRLFEILRDPGKLMEVIRQESLAILEQYEDRRRTEIQELDLDRDDLDFVAEDTMVVTLSQLGYIKSQSMAQYSAQRRGGKGKKSVQIKEEDALKQLLVISNHGTLLCFSSRGKVYWLPAHHVPEGSRANRGRPIHNFLSLQEDEFITTMFAVDPHRDTQGYEFVMATEKGFIKKVALEEFSRPRSTGVIAIGLDEGDRLVSVKNIRSHQDILLFSTEGKVVRFPGDEVRVMGRAARGVMGMRTGGKHHLVAMIVMDASSPGSVLTVTAHGYGKQTLVAEYRCVSRNSKGVIAMKTDAKTGPVIDAQPVEDAGELLLIGNAGSLVRLRIHDISTLSRNTKGVRLMNLDPSEHFVGMAVIPQDLLDEAEEGEEEV